MIKKILFYVVAFNLVFVLGIISGLSLRSMAKTTQPQKTEVKNISGAPLTATDYTDNSGVHINADYSGAGSSVINVPIMRIPQAAAWIEKRNSLTVLASPRGNVTPIYSRRWDQLTASAAVRVPVLHPLSLRDYDIMAGAGLVW